MNVIYFVWYFSIFYYTLYFSIFYYKILATNIDSITSYSKIREEIKSMYVCMYDTCRYPTRCVALSWPYYLLISNRCKWNDCFIKNAPKIG